MAPPLQYNYLDVVVGIIHVANIDETDDTYVDDEYVDNHDYDDGTDDDKAWRRRDLLLAGQPASRPAGWPPSPHWAYPMGPCPGLTRHPMGSGETLYGSN